LNIGIGSKATSEDFKNLYESLKTACIYSKNIGSSNESIEIA
jgi:hypothetical protein